MFVSPYLFWNDETLNNFVTEWQNLSNEETQVALTGAKIKRLKGAIYKQFMEEKALVAVTRETNASATQQKRLIEFSKTIGIDDSRLSE